MVVRKFLSLFFCAFGWPILPTVLRSVFLIDGRSDFSFHGSTSDEIGLLPTLAAAVLSVSMTGVL